MAVCRTTRDGRGFTEPLCPDLKDFLSSSFLGAPHAICGSQTTGYDVFNFKRQPVFSSEVGCLVTPIGEGDLPRAIVEVKLVGTGGSGDFHPADFCMGTACIQGTCPSLFPDHLNSFIPLSFFYSKVRRLGPGIWRRSQTHLFQESSCARMPPDTLILHGLNYKVEFHGPEALASHISARVPE